MKVKQVMTRKLQGRKPSKTEQQEEDRSKTEVEFLFLYKESALLPEAKDWSNCPFSAGYHFPPTRLLQLKRGPWKEAGAGGLAANLIPLAILILV